MSRTLLALTGTVLLVVGVVLGWAVSREGNDASDADALTTEVDNLRTRIEDQAVRICRLEEALRDRAAPEIGAGSTGTSSTTLTGRGSAGPTDPLAPSRLSVEEGRRILTDLEANTDGTRVVAIRDALQRFVAIGDPIVPDIVNLLKSGIDTRYVDRKLMLQHVEGYVGLRMVLIDALREIGTPAARQGLLDAVATSRDVRDFRDLLVHYYSSTDQAFVDAVVAMIPDMLRRLAEVGVAADDYEAQELAIYVAFWIRKHELTDALKHVVEVLLRMPSDNDRAHMAYDRLFSVLVEYRPERAAEVALALEEKHPGRGLLLWCSRQTDPYQTPRAHLVRYFGVLLSRRDLATNVRGGLYATLPDKALHGIEDPEERSADAQALVTLLESRLADETDENLEYMLRRKIESLRASIEEIGK
jgi:hypothetical protein